LVRRRGTYPGSYAAGRFMRWQALAGRRRWRGVAVYAYRWHAGAARQGAWARVRRPCPPNSTSYHAEQRKNKEC